MQLHTGEMSRRLNVSAAIQLPAWDAALYHGHRFDAADVGKRAAAEGNKADT